MRVRRLLLPGFTIAGVFVAALTMTSAAGPLVAPPGPTSLTVARTSRIAPSWTVMSAVNAPAPRYHHAAIWTGREMIVWGGTNFDRFFQDGARYNPATDSWSPISTANAPSERSLHVAAWTGTDMIVWGGTQGRLRGDFVADGASYNPNSDVWTALPPSPLRPRVRAQVIWTGDDVIIWGGSGGTDASPEFFGDGARFNPATKAWTLLPSGGAPSPRWGESMIWTGHDLIIWGGEGGTAGAVQLNDGASFDPVANRWSPLPLAGAPSARTTQATAWNGQEMLVWGGQGGGVVFRDGARFTSTTGVWSTLTPAGAPSARANLNAYWTGTKFAVWGGIDRRGQLPWDGALFDPTTLTWAPLPTTPLTPRDEPTTLWTGRDLIMWGGVHQAEGSGSAQVIPDGDGTVLQLNDSAATP